jgi:hypothetical protein
VRDSITSAPLRPFPVFPLLSILFVLALTFGARGPVQAPSAVLVVVRLRCPDPVLQRRTAPQWVHTPGGADQPRLPCLRRRQRVVQGVGAPWALRHAGVPGPNGRGERVCHVVSVPAVPCVRGGQLRLLRLRVPGFCPRGLVERVRGDEPTGTPRACFRTGGGEGGATQLPPPSPPPPPVPPPS